MPYNTDTGYLASTTGNISGIYDMSGGGNECIFSLLLKQNGILTIGPNRNENTGFNGLYSNEANSNTNGLSLPDEKYYDKYLYEEYGNNNYNLSRRILGDATGEVGPPIAITSGTLNRAKLSWYEDYANIGTAGASASWWSLCIWNECWNVCIISFIWRYY